MNRSDEASEDRISRLCTALGRTTASLRRSSERQASEYSRVEREQVGG